jgi:hypothetical protein
MPGRKNCHGTPSLRDLRRITPRMTSKNVTAWIAATNTTDDGIEEIDRAAPPH